MSILQFPEPSHFRCGAGAARKRSYDVIGLTGHMGAGKDAAAALLSMIGYTRIAFADQVRTEVEDAIARRMIPAKAVDAPSIARDLARVSRGDVWAKPTGEPMRRILQWWGTEYRRSEDPDYWIATAMQQAERARLCVFSDVRFPNEVEAIRRRGGWIWKIERDTIPNGIPAHPSETYVDEIVPDLVIPNTGTLLDLATRIAAALKQ